MLVSDVVQLDDRDTSVIVGSSVAICVITFFEVYLQYYIYEYCRRAIAKRFTIGVDGQVTLEHGSTIDTTVDEPIVEIKKRIDGYALSIPESMVIGQPVRVDQVWRTMPFTGERRLIELEEEYHYRTPRVAGSEM